MVICLERGADLQVAQVMPLPLTVSCSSKIQIGFTFLVPAHPGSPGKRAVKRVCVGKLVMVQKNLFNGPLSGSTQVSRYQKGKPIWILLKQETVSGSGVSWAICKSAPRSRQITTPAPHHSVFYRPDALPTNSVKALKATSYGGVRGKMQVVTTLC